MYSFFVKKAGLVTKSNCLCQIQMFHTRKIDKFMLLNSSFYHYSTINRLSYPSLSTYKNKNFVNSKCILLRNSYFPHVLGENHNNAISIRYFHASNSIYAAEPNKPSSKVEETVEVLKDKVKAKSSAPAPLPENVVVKKSKIEVIKDVVLHYYHGFRLLFIDIRVSTILAWRVLNGKTLTRREHKLLVRTVGDMFRLVPFSVFIIVPFMELLLPFFIKFFPGMLPSTFQKAEDKEDKFKQSLKIKLETAKFLQQTLDEMAVTGKGHSSQAAKDFAQFFEKVRKTGGMASNEEIMKFSKLFQDEITLDSIARPQLMALCRVLDLQTFGTSNFLRFQLRMKLRSLAADDKMILKEGIDSLSRAELQQACRARGMRALGLSEDRLKEQLSQWLDLSLNKKVPPSLLLLSRAFMLPETITTTQQLAATISALPDTVGTKTKAVIGELEGKVDNKTKIEVIKEEVARIKEERKEQKEETERLAKEEVKDKELLVDKAAVIKDKAPELLDPLKITVPDIDVKPSLEKPKEDVISTKDLEALEDALDTLAKDKKKFLVEKEELDDLKEEMADYQKDVDDLKQVTQMSEEDKATQVKESVAAKRLSRSVTKMISKMDKILLDLEKKEQDLLSHQDETSDKSKDELLKVEEVIQAIQKIREEGDESRAEKIGDLLDKLDADKDGVVKVEDVLKIRELFERENVNLSKKQMDEIIDVISKEEAVKVESEEKDVENSVKSSAQEEAENLSIEEKSKKSLNDQKKTKFSEEIFSHKLPKKEQPIPPNEQDLAALENSKKANNVQDLKKDL